MAGSSSSTPLAAISATANLSFLFSVEEIRPHYASHAPRHKIGNVWLPPNRKTGLLPQCSDQIQGTLFRWQDGKVSIVNRNTYPHARQLNSRTSNPYTYRVHTIFMDNRGSFSAVNFDARRKDVRDAEIGEWREIGFHHRYTQGNTHVFSDLDMPGAHLQLAGPAATTNLWYHQLFPLQYHWNPSAGTDYPTALHAGLVGKLPLIIAMAVFSCQRGQSDFVLTNCCTGFGKWQLHGATHGREEERGLVVTVFQDTQGTTTMDHLKRLEDGRYGSILKN